MVERHNKILDILKEKNEVSVQFLSSELDISAVTIRKDLKILEQKKLLFRNHGGATITQPYVNDRPVNIKESINYKEKIAIANEAIKIIDNDQYIIIASGTTVTYFANKINPVNRITIVTSALNVASELLNKEHVEILQLGGYVRHSSNSVIGHYSELILKETACSKLFMGVDGIDIDYGISTSNAQEAHLNQQMMESSKEVIVLADSSKFGKRSFGRICGLDMVDHIITDENISQKIVDRIIAMGIKITIAKL